MKDKIIALGFTGFISLVLIINILTPDKAFSLSERRSLEGRPQWTRQDVFSGDFFEDFNQYSLDQFMFRDPLRTLKHGFAYYVLGQKDINGIYYGQGHIFKEVTASKDSQDHFLKYIQAVEGRYFKGNKVYFAMIPDKAYYGEHMFKPDDQALAAYLKEGLPSIINIDLIDSLSLGDYYQTDPHWRQDKLEDVMKTLSDAMGFETYKDLEQVVLEDFKGAYYSQGPLYRGHEDLSYLYHEDFNHVEVLNYEKSNVLYSVDKIKGMDPYDVFLGGASPLIELTNPRSKTEAELIIFRDSFSSSIGPLFLKHYRKVTLVDTRYMPVEALEDYIEVKDQDVLMMYASLMIQSSYGLK